MKKVFLESLPRCGSRINWKLSKGMSLEFIYDDIQGVFEIKDYLKDSQKLIIEYKGKSFEILTSSVINANLSRILGLISSEFKVDIGTELIDSNRQIIIIDRKIIKSSQVDKKTGVEYPKIYKEYKYHCNECGNEDWVQESNLINRKVGCNVCCNRKTLLGVNSIYDTDIWMCNLGLSEDIAKTHSKCSNKKVKVKCPICEHIKNVKIADVYRNKSIGCTCGDGFSYGHKYMFAVLKQLNVPFNDNVKFDWCSFYNTYRDKVYIGEYDFVVEDLKLIIEVDGEFHRVNNNLSGQTKEESELIDSEKDRLAEENGYEIIRIFYDSNNTEIDSYICESRLAYIFDLSNIDKNKCEEFAITNNKIKEICTYWANKDECETAYTIGEKFSTNPTIVRRYLTKGTKLGWCEYNPKEEFDKSRVRCGNTIRKKLSKEVEIFKDGISLGAFNSCVELSKASEEIFGVKLLDSKISSVANGKRKTHKGYTFKYVENEEVA